MRPHVGCTRRDKRLRKTKTAARHEPGGQQAEFGIGQMAFFAIWSAMYSAWRIASVTIVRVGFSAPPVVNWLPSEMNRLFTSWAWPNLLHTPSRGLADMRQVPRLCVEG